MQILMSTVNARFVPSRAGLDGSVFVVVNQIIPTGGDKTECKKYETRHKVFAALEDRRESGVARSRNRAMDLATEDICLLGDDDQVYFPDTIDRVECAFAMHPEADIITFMERMPQGNLRKSYPKQAMRHSVLSAMRVREPEIAFRLPRIRRFGLRFDEDFGFSKYVIGEGYIFLVDAIKKGLKVMFVPEVISIHPAESTATMGSTAKNVMYSKGAMFRRALGPMSIPFLLAFFLKKTIQRRIPPWKFLYYLFSGWLDYGRSCFQKPGSKDLTNLQH